MNDSLACSGATIRRAVFETECGIARSDAVSLTYEN